MLLTEPELSATTCPLLNTPCIGRKCFALRASKLVDRRNGQRLFFCGVAGQAGAWHPYGATARDVGSSDSQAKSTGKGDVPTHVIG